MGNALAKKLSQFSCKSSCIIDKTERNPDLEREFKEHRKYIKKLTLSQMIKIKEMIEKQAFAASIDTSIDYGLASNSSSSSSSSSSSNSNQRIARITIL